jgi:hypothetical protein
LPEFTLYFSNHFQGIYPILRFMVFFSEFLFAAREFECKKMVAFGENGFWHSTANDISVTSA